MHSRRCLNLISKIKAHMPFKVTFLVGLVGLLSGCVPYPIYKTLQPAASATVIDLDSKPIEAAQVTLITNSAPSGREPSRETQPTNRTGIAVFSARREWRVEVMALHGWQDYFWAWCVEKPGFLTFSSSNSGAPRFVVNPVVRLMPGESTPCPGDYPAAR